MKEINITDIKGIRVGQAQNHNAGTGCTVILCEQGAIAGVDVRGGGPATRETDLLNPINMIQQIHAVMLSGGSAFGLDAASGVMQYLEEHGIGIDMKVAHVPIVCSACLFDLSVGDASIRPDKAMGYAACVDSEACPKPNEGNYGAGTGASVGKVLGFDHAMKSGLGTYAMQIGDLQVAAIVAVNACGNVIDVQTREELAGIYNAQTDTIMNACDCVIDQLEAMSGLPQGNTTLGCIVTNAKLDKAQCTKIAGITHNAYANVIQPVHTMSDGDTIFVLSTQEVDIMPDAIGILATKAMTQAIERGVKESYGAYGLKAFRDIKNKP